MVSQYFDKYFKPLASKLGISGSELSETIFTEASGEAINSIVNLTMEPFGGKLVKGVGAIAAYIACFVLNKYQRRLGPLSRLGPRAKSEIIRIGTHLGTQVATIDPPTMKLAMQQAFSFGQGLVELNPAKIFAAMVKPTAVIQTELAKIKNTFQAFTGGLANVPAKLAAFGNNALSKMKNPLAESRYSAAAVNVPAVTPDIVTRDTPLSWNGGPRATVLSEMGAKVPAIPLPTPPSTSPPVVNYPRFIVTTG